MARRPFFSGNYGSALGSYDTAARLLAGAGQAQGQMFASLGADIGGAIEKYQLNKRKNMELDGQIDGTIAGMEGTDVFDFDVEVNNNSKLRKLMEKHTEGNTTQAEKAQLAGYLSSRSKQQDLRRLRQSQDVAREMNEQRLGLARKMEDSQVRLSESTADAKANLNRLNLINIESLPEKDRVALEIAKESLAGQILRIEGARENLAEIRGIRGVLPPGLLGEYKRRALEAGVRKDEAGAVIAEEGAEQAEFAGAVRGAGPTPETIAERGERERLRVTSQQVEEEALREQALARKEDEYWAGGTPEERGKRERLLLDARTKLARGQATAQDISNLKALAPPSIQSQVDTIQKEMAALLKVAVTGGDTVKDFLATEPDPETVEWIYVQKYKSLQDQLSGLFDDNLKVGVRVE